MKTTITPKNIKKSNEIKNIETQIISNEITGQKYKYHCTLCSLNIRNKHNVNKHILCNKHIKKAICNNQYCYNIDGVPLCRINPKKKTEMIIEKETTVLPTKSKIKRTKNNKNKEYNLIDLCDLNKHVNITDYEYDVIIRKLSKRVSLDEFNNQFDFDGYNEEYNIGNMTLDEKSNFVYQLCVALLEIAND